LFANTVAMPVDHRHSHRNQPLPQSSGCKIVIALLAFYALTQFLTSDDLYDFIGSTKKDTDRLGASMATESSIAFAARPNTRNRKSSIEAGATDNGSKQIPASLQTKMNRYPDEYAAVKQYVEDSLSDKPNKRILSFGAATGFEAISLATLYFTGAKHANTLIYGVDLDQHSLDKGMKNVASHVPPIEDNKITFFNGKDTHIEKYGKYDAIFANSVFCLLGIGTFGAYSFEDFENSLRYLDASLNEGGLLAIVNMSYEFSESMLAKRYKPVAKCAGNFVTRYNREKDEWVSLNKKDKMDCVWVKERSYL